MLLMKFNGEIFGDTRFFLFLVILKDNSCDAPVMLVANKIDQYGDRMVLVEDGQRRYREIGCVGFREISVRESIEQVNSFTLNTFCL